MSAIAKPIWAGRNMRLDPQRLPQAVSYALAGEGDTTFTITSRGAVMQKAPIGSSENEPYASLLPASAFKGVAARGMEDDEGNATVTLELMHEDEKLSVPLLVAHDLDSVADDWHRWAALFNLPMMLIEADGIARTLDESLEKLEGDVERTPRPAKASFGAYHSKGLGVRVYVNGAPIIAANDK